MNLIRFIRNNDYIPLVIFAVSMGFLEAIVVVYIREIYYPDGFRFPLKELPPRLIVIEWIREISTLLMLGSVGWISGKYFLKRMSVFLFIFGVWDILYYVGLKIFLDWPESLLTWDILFLIPITWVSPVLAPVICSILMIVMALLLDFRMLNNNLKKLETKEFVLLITGATVIFFTFTVDFGMMLIEGNFLKHFFTLAENREFIGLLTTWQPLTFNWGIFILGILIIFVAIFLINKRSSAN
ncbi:MAG TPA: hypothetical protein VLQ91_08520 [Draconibacterium sp.]|nr:hypothetical protein [Draconibacterium sp.]